MLDQKGYYLRMLRKGYYEPAFHALKEINPMEVIPFLIMELSMEKNEKHAKQMLEILFQFRDERIYTIMEQYLSCDKELLWKTALDGLVAFGTSKAGIIIKKELQGKTISSEKQIWLNEALEQILERLKASN